MDLSSLNPHSTDEQKATLQTRTNNLRRKILAWIDIQHLYMPTLRIARANEAASDGQMEEGCESIKLYLPSSIPPFCQCDMRLQTIEWQLRFGQANDALEKLRNGLRLRSHLYNDKDRFQRGQHANTRSRTLIARVDAKISACAAMYRAARKALLGLAQPMGRVGVDGAFPELKPTDVRGMKEFDDGLLAKRRRQSDRPSEGRRTVSWIWTRLGDGTSMQEDKELHEGVLTQFLESRNNC